MCISARLSFTLCADDTLLSTNLHFPPLCFPIICRAVVHIQVNDVNEFAPVFREPVYRAAVTEGKIYDSILQVEATDQDCSPQYSQICNYQISSTNTPFAIDRNGEWRRGEHIGSFQRWEVVEFKYFVTVLKYIFLVSVLYSTTYFSDDFLL